MTRPVQGPSRHGLACPCNTLAGVYTGSRPGGAPVGRDPARPLPLDADGGLLPCQARFDSERGRYRWYRSLRITRSA